MRIGVALPRSVHTGPGPWGWPELRDLAVRLEESGFDALWVSDDPLRDAASPGGPAAVEGRFDAMVLLSALAVATNRTQLGTLDLDVGLQPPAVLAKAVASLDRLSGGRFVLGLGGWDEAEYQAAGLVVPSEVEQFERLHEAVVLVREMTTHPRATVAGRHYRVDDAPNLPQPTQPAVPILVTGLGRRAMRIAAQSADIWHVSGHHLSIGTYARRVAEFERACEEAGRDPEAVEKSLELVALVGVDEGDTAGRFEDWRRQAPRVVKGASPAAYAEHGLVGTAQQVLERIEQYRELGVTELALRFSPIPSGWSSSSGWDIVAQELLPVYREASR